MTSAGFLVLDKPLGLSSRQALDRARRAYGVRQAGYAGTLDPLATGVLVCAFGPATRLLRYLEQDDKRYTATIEFGRETTTDDAEGETVATGEWRPVTRDAIEAALPQFRGPIRQRPPSFSAISVGGQRLYAAARRGEAVVAPERDVTIHALDVVAWRPPLLDISVHCSKGTYIRALARDIGRVLGCFGFLAALRRIASGRFTLGQAVSLEQVGATPPAALPTLLLPLPAAIGQFPTVVVNGAAARQIRLGQRLPWSEATAERIALLDEAGELVAIARHVGEALQPEKVFPASDDDGAGAL